MKITVLVIGKQKDFAAHELVSEYSDRVSHYAPIDWIYLHSSDREDENIRLLKTIDKLKQGGGCHIVSLDETGKEYDSRGFATFVQTRLNEGLKSLIFVIGGSYGISDEVKSTSQSLIALAKMTFPHQLVRLILAEQIYRAMTIIKGEKYHH